MMKRRVLSVLLCLCLLMGLVAGIQMLPVAATQQWQTGTDGVGQYTTVTEGDMAVLGVNRLAGLTPTVTDEDNTEESFGKSLAKLTDGSFGTAAGDYAATTQKSFANEWASITYDLGKDFTITNALAASPLRDTAAEGDWYLRWIRVYISDREETLYTAANLVAQALKLDTTYEDVILQPQGGSAIGRYVGFQFWVPGNRGTFDSTANLYSGTNLNFTDAGVGISKNQWGVLQIGELAVYGNEHLDWQTGTQGVGAYAPAGPADLTWQGTNRLLGLTPTVKDESGNAESFGDSVSKLTDGSFGTAAGDYAVTSEKNLSNEWASLTYDLESEVEITRLLVASPVRDTVTEGDWLLRWIQVYVSDEEDKLFSGDNLVCQALKLEDSYRNMLLQPQDGSATGRYVGFRFWVPGTRGTFDATKDLYSGTNLNFTDTGVGISKDQWGVLQIGELAVFGKDAVNWQTGTQVVGKYAAATEADLTAHGDNLLVGLTPTVTDEEATKDNFGTSLSKLTDGSFGAAVGDYAATTQKSFVNEWASLQFDLGQPTKITEMLAASPLRDTATEGDWYLRWIRVYVGHDADTLFSETNLVSQVLKLDTAYADVLLQPQGGSATGRYVGFQFWVPGARGTFDSTADLYTGTNLNFTDAGTGISKNQWGVLQIGELAVYGKAVVDEPLIIGQLPVDAYLCRPGDVANSITAGGPKYGEGDVSLYTDGDLETMASICLYEGITVEGAASTQTDLFNLAADTPWQVFIYHLGGTARVNSLSLSSASPYAAGVDFYVGQTLATLFDEANRVYTTQGEKTTLNESDQTILDPAYDAPLQTHTYNCFDVGNQPTTGRYAAFVVTRPYASTKKGWYYGRVSEMTVTGERTAPEETVNQTVVDKASGIKVTLSQLNYDDVEFFKKLGGLTVTVSDLPSTVNKQVEDNWFVADSAVYTLQLTDIAGRVLTATETGNRFWQIEFPHTVKHTQTMGLLRDNTLTRIRNAYTTGDGTVVRAGSDYTKVKNTAHITGNSLQFVYLRFNTVEDITGSAGQTGGTVTASPVNGNATSAAKNVLQYMYDLSGSRQFLTGAFDMRMDNYSYGQVKEQFGTELAIYSTKYQTEADDGTETSLRFKDVDVTNDLLEAHYKNGNILLVQDNGLPLNYFANLADAQGLGLGDSCSDIVCHWDATNTSRNAAVYNAYVQYVDDLVAALKDLESRGVEAYMLRCFVEFNNNSNPAYGATAAGRTAFINVWRQLADRLEAEGLQGYLLTYAPTAYTDTQSRYPGDDYVDVLSVTMYSSVGDDGVMGADYFKNYAWYCNTGKPIGFSELGCRSGTWASVQSENRCSWFNAIKDCVERWPQFCWVNCWDGAGYALSDYYNGTRWYGNDDGALLVNSPFSVNLKDMPDLYGDGSASVLPLVTKGASVRSYDEDGMTALRFGFDVTMSGVTMDAATYEGDFSAATITLNGQSYTVLDAGTLLVSGGMGSAVDLTVDTTNTAVKIVPAKKIYEIQGDLVTYTAVVTNIASANLSTPVIARPYVAYRADGMTQYIYGETISRSVTAVYQTAGT